MDRHSVAIVGGGIAGAATAYFLTQRGLRRVVIVERDTTAGSGSTGRNAAILRTLIPDPVLRGLARKAAEFYFRPPAGFAANSLVDRAGIYLAAQEQHASSLLSCVDNSREEPIPLMVDPARLYRKLPLLAPGLTHVLHQPEEGVFDVHAILQSFLKGARTSGVELRTRCEAKRIRAANGHVEGLETSDGFLPAERVVIASGGWAALLGAEAGYPLPLTPFRRHLLVTEALPNVDRRWPVVWILGDEFYFRPESGGLLMCGCDTAPVSPNQGESVDPLEVERTAAKAAHWLPSLAETAVLRAWAGMRTFAPDRRFVIGADPRLDGLFWVAGLGGHGITCAPAVGELAAECIAEGGSSNPSAAALAPDRLLRRR